MISKNRIKYLHSLDLKKNRKKTQEFVAEGVKLVDELLPVFECVYVAAVPEWIRCHESQVAALREKAVVDDLSEEELRRASLLQHPQEVIAVFRQPVYKDEAASLCEQELVLALDGVQDPGNLGTIVRVADWFGIEHILCAPSTADIYNPKAVQATMGSLARVRLHYVDLKELIYGLPAEVPVYGTFLDGKNLYKESLSSRGLIVMGNEGNGISEELRPLINRRLLIPNYPEGRQTAESLNVAMATGIICAEFRRRQ